MDYEECNSYTDGRPAKRRHRSAVACQRCKSRKQRCDNEFPSCSNCVCAGEPCAYGSKQVYPAEYVRSLEGQIAQLRRSLASAKPNIVLDHHTNPQGSQHICEDFTATSDDAIAEELEPRIELGVGFVAYPPNLYLGTSSGYPLAKLVKSTVNVTSMGLPRRGAMEGTDCLNYPSRSSDRLEPDVSTPKAEMPSDEIGDKLIGAYFFRVHPKYCFLSRKRITTLNKNRGTLRPTYQSRSFEVGHLDYAILHLVYAIGARYIQLANDQRCPSPEAHHAAALADIDAILEVRSLENLEAMLLLSIYQLRLRTGPGIWWMIGTTMRYCVDCGLHRKSNHTSPLFEQRRKRIFWTAYMLERSVARTVGRPCSIADREIDIDLPANIDDSLGTDEEITAAILESSTNPHQITSLTAAIHIIKLQQLESKICKTVCRVDKPISSISPDKIAELRHALEEWKANIPKVQDAGLGERPPYTATDYYMIQYHKALLLLFLPFLSSLTATHPDFRQVAYSAGQICQLYKRHHENQSYISYSLLALHATFVAGLVMVYCYCLDPSLFDTKFSSDIRACSSLLYTISERWTAAREVRRAFESLVAATIESQHDQPGSKVRVLGKDCSHSNEPFQLEAQSFLPTPSNRSAAEGKSNYDVWASFETVLEDYQINTETWMPDSIFLAIDGFPAESYGEGGEIM